MLVRYTLFIYFFFCFFKLFLHEFSDVDCIFYSLFFCRLLRVRRGRGLKMMLRMNGVSTRLFGCPFQM